MAPRWALILAGWLLATESGQALEPVNGTRSVAVSHSESAPSLASDPLHATPAGVWVEREAFAMGTRLAAAVQADTRRAAIQAIEAAFGEVRRLEHLLSSWSDASALASVNSAAVGVPVDPGPELWDLLREADEWVARTDGAFDPGIGALIDPWDLRGEGRRPSVSELHRALRASGIHRFRFESGGRRVVRLAPGAWIDTGAFGKGAALRAAARVLQARRVTAAWLDFGGQVVAVGAPDGAGQWPVAVAHPARRSEIAFALRLSGGFSAATSGASERFIQVGGERYGHILDPRTGFPVRAWGSVTVVAPDPLFADLWATALFVLGPEGAARRAEALDQAGVLILAGTDGAAPRWNRALEPFLDRDSPTATLTPSWSDRSRCAPC